MDRQDETNAIAKELKSQALILGTLVAIFWIVEIVDVVVFQGRLDTFGILPRHPIGLRGILLAPFLHGSFNHLIANTLPFLTLGWLVMLKETRDFFIVSAITLLISGLGVWLFGSPGFHIGASGVIFGYLGFLLLRGYFERSFVTIFLSVVVGFFYGSLLWGVLPTVPGISWEGHLFGFIGGGVAAYLLSDRAKSKTL
ncbi:rhomboid family intramembrane serine protease [Desertifilum sp. FACHB-1129]|uniref:Rhomboid family intramembrane serine protease n=2 Tax=Desertifilum tharense IPPAS B-1220 TaxID=1781255 RepID=A0A1E5QLH9_9CYAN|nr:MULTISPECIES: rhomboid family intramembrane serine protease [Desertifilum]MDA0208764.1 rhomboid family intramembrane serine protease [Cyanobacteria bacterium FC1]MBD2310966.1 rhomboid family intramembrane serine protease [Desertifilum sp. FACHB-1129]MBD2321371.1 rhomboid family intramembrane serine protease [Desertifilum sp. FACHB-866]MBD2331322.1 rhomboid family intramembrane serine protease [Desertifilum sp. FACHB-868]OEJ75542.1 rhomboid family intramembrane serine protease [Desertifilum 